MDRLPLDENERLAAHWLLLSAACGEALGALELTKLRSGLFPQRQVGLVGASLADTLGLVDCSRQLADQQPSHTAIAVSLEKGLMPTLLAEGALRMDAAALLPASPGPSGEEIGRRVLTWANENCMRVHLGIVSFVDVPIKVRWASTGGEEQVKSGGRNASVTYYRTIAWWTTRLGETFDVLEDGGSRWARDLPRRSAPRWSCVHRATAAAGVGGPRLGRTD